MSKWRNLLQDVKPAAEADVLDWQPNDTRKEIQPKSLEQSEAAVRVLMARRADLIEEIGDVERQINKHLQTIAERLEELGLHQVCGEVFRCSRCDK